MCFSLSHVRLKQENKYLSIRKISPSIYLIYKHPDVQLSNLQNIRDSKPESKQ